MLLNGHSITSTASGVNGIVCQVRCLVKGPGKISVDFAIVHSGHLRRQSLRVEDVNLEDNGYSAILSLEGFVLARNVTVTGNSFEHPPMPPGATPVVRARRLFGRNLTVTNNDSWGIITSARLRLIDSIVTGNSGDGTGGDIVAFHRPRLVHSTCGQSLVSACRSSRARPGPSPCGSWGVCTGDPY